MVKGQNKSKISKTKRILLQNQQKQKKYLQKNQGVWKVERASELSLVSGNYH